MKAFWDFCVGSRPVWYFFLLFGIVNIFVKCIIQSVFFYKQEPDSKNYKTLSIFLIQNKRHFMGNFSGRSLMITSTFSCNKIFWFIDLHSKLHNWYSLRCAWVVALDSIHTALCYICCSNNSIMLSSIRLFHLVFLICKVLILKWKIVYSILLIV